MDLASHEYRVDLDIYNGPLDLLLYLIKRDEVDIYDIPIASITEQFFHYIEVLKALDLNIVGDFLVMAATLMEIKSRMLLPDDELAEEGDEDDDPRLELVRQLIEYKRFKDAASTLGSWAEEQDKRLPRPGELGAAARESEGRDFDEDIEIWQLVEAFAKLMQQTGLGLAGTVVYDDTPVSEYIEAILKLLRERTIVSFFDLFEDCRSKSAILGTFLALLELTKQRLVRFEQTRDFGEIIISIRLPQRQAPAARPLRWLALLPQHRGAAGRLPRPVTQFAYQRTARRWLLAVPARQRVYRSLIVAVPDAAPPPAPSPEPAEPETNDDPADNPAPQPAPAMVVDDGLDDLSEVDAVEVADLVWDAPEGWAPPPPSQAPRMPLRRPLARGKGRRLFRPSYPRGFERVLPIKRRLVWPQGPAGADEPLPSVKPGLGPEPTLEAAPESLALAAVPAASPAATAAQRPLEPAPSLSVAAAAEAECRMLHRVRGHGRGRSRLGPQPRVYQPALPHRPPRLQARSVATVPAPAPESEAPQPAAVPPTLSWWRWLLALAVRALRAALGWLRWLAGRRGA